MKANCSIGIDLGTTNCALSFLELGPDGAESEVLAVSQLEGLNTEVEREVLPSFLAWEGEGEWKAGLFARNRSQEVPDRVVHSAKSWLCHHSVSPEAAILPWKSKLVPDGEKLSPIEASAKLLGVLKDAWEVRFGHAAPFVEQAVTITVPASFDAAAQAATLQAAKLAGYPEGVRLLEEPQAAFYRWLEETGTKTQGLVEGECILVVDIGGGTSDFSLFRVGESIDDVPRIERVSVSEHLLLGGDNIDLALAHALESELSPDGQELSVDQWGHLVSRARELKEVCLSEQEDRAVPVSIPSRGAGLFSGTLSTEVSSQLARTMVLEGFFPECSAGAAAEKAEGGLLEWGLPYAVDCAVTRHLAEFLGVDVRVDRVLFNGGSLSAPVVRERLLEQISAWQNGRVPLELENREPYLAVARGAARFGEMSWKGQRRIDAGAPRAVFLELSRSGGEGSEALCVLPKGAQPGDRYEIGVEGLQLRTKERVAFKAYQAGDQVMDAAGSRRQVDGMRALPVLVSVIAAEGRESVPIRLVSGMNELGLLSIACEALDGSGSWPLEFNLRTESGGERGVAPIAPDADEVKRAKLARAMKAGMAVREPKASRVFSQMESVAGAKKHEWSLSLCRRLLGDLLELGGIALKSDSAVETWLQVSGYLMRPGFGAAGDDQLRNRLIGEIASIGRNPVRIEVQRLICLRRVAAGFPESEQVRFFDEELESLKSVKRAVAERIRFLGSLEKVDLERKQLLFYELKNRLDHALEGSGDVKALLAGLGGLLSRVLFQAPLDRVVSPEQVEELFAILGKSDWKSDRFRDAIPLFLGAARIVDDRSLNVSNRYLRKLIAKLEKSGVASNRLLPLRDYVPVEKDEQAASFGESLPPGLVLA